MEDRRVLKGLDKNLDTNTKKIRTKMVSTWSKLF